MGLDKQLDKADAKLAAFEQQTQKTEAQFSRLQTLWQKPIVRFVVKAAAVVAVVALIGLVVIFR